MKLFVLGGYGKTGFAATELLAQGTQVSEIAIAGRDLERAEKAARRIGRKAIAVHADGTDAENLASLVAGYDIVINAATYEAVLPAMQAAIQSGAHYCDMDFVEQVLQLAPDAQAAGVTGVIATGISPCISNLMGVHVASQLNEVEQLQLGRAGIFNFQSGRELTPRQWLKDPAESLAALHEFRPFIAMMLHILKENGIRTALDYRDGEWVEVDPIRSGLDIPHLEGGTITSYPYVSCDSFWGAIPRHLSKIPPAETWFTPFPPQLHDQLRKQALRVIGGDTDTDTAVSYFYDTIESDPHRWLTLPDDFVITPKMWARAVGRKNGRAARYSCWFTSAMWSVSGYFLTSVALAAAVRFVLRGEIRERGVMTAETVFEPLLFFDEVIRLLPEPPPDGKLIGEAFEWLE